MKKILTALLASVFSINLFALDMQVVAHRGVPDTIVENTAESIAKAFELGATWVETDFHHTQAGQMVCIHCSIVLKKLSGVDKKVKDLTPEDLKTINIGKNSKDGKVYRIPLLEDILKLVPKNAILQAEIKGYSPQYADLFVKAMKDANLKSTNFVISSFQYDAIADFKKKYPEFETMWLVASSKFKNPGDLIAEAKKINVKYIALGASGLHKIDFSYAQKIRDAGFDVRVWGVQNLELLKHAIRIGATGFTTNHYKKMLNEYSKQVEGVKLLP